jgi:hypothetical protein
MLIFMDIGKLPFGVRVRTQQLLQEEAEKVAQRRGKAATQLNALKGAKTKTALNDGQKTLQAVLVAANVSPTHRCLYCLLSALSSAYKQRTEKEAQICLQVLLSCGVGEALQLSADPLEDLCEELFVCEITREFPSKVDCGSGENFYARSIGALVKECISPAIANRDREDPPPLDEIFAEGNPLRIFKLKDDIAEDDPKFRIFAIRAVQYARTQAIKSKMDGMRKAINASCIETLSGARISARNGLVIEECFKKFLHVFTTALAEPPLREFFPGELNDDDVRKFRDEIYTHFREEFLQFADGSSAPNGERLDFFNGRISVKDSSTLKESVHSLRVCSMSRCRGSMPHKDLTAPAIAKLSELISNFRKDLKTCLCSDDVKFFLQSNYSSRRQLMSFREQFAAAANAWLNSKDGNSQTTRGENFANLQKEYDSALEEFQKPLGEA